MDGLSLTSNGRTVMASQAKRLLAALADVQHRVDKKNDTPSSVTPSSVTPSSANVVSPERAAAMQRARRALGAGWEGS